MSEPAAAHAERLRQDAAELVRQGRLEAAEGLLREAMRLEPASARIQALLGEALLGQGRYAEAWPLIERRFDVPELGSPRPPLEQPEWRGEPFGGKRLLIVGEQGAGDQIMYARFAPIAQARGTEVMLLCLPSLARLFGQNLGVEVFPMAGRVDLPDPDGWTTTASLPSRLGVTLETLPGEPYLAAAPRRLGGRIGVMAQGNPRHRHDAHRSLPSEAAARLLGLAGAIDLSPAATGAQDFQDTAEIVAGLELVISVDTSVAHLAGAMGKPVWILLPAYGLDWRWMRGRADSPWYPTARLFRQGAPGDWASVVDEVEAALRGT